jgi:hypothetical protein
MHRTPLAIALAGAIVATASAGVAGAARTDVVPVHGGTGCTTQPPHLLTAGRAPLAPVRLDLSGMAHRSLSLVEVERFASRARLLDGKWHSTTVVRKIDDLVRGGAIAHGQVGLVAKIKVSFPATRTSAGGRGATFSTRGHTDALSGGLLGGTAGNDRLPVEAIGVGARWSVVLCDEVDETPAREARTYTVRSITRDRLVASFRDVLSLDPAHRDVGTQKIGSEVVHFRLDALHGSATGTNRVDLAHGLASSTTVVTRVQYSFHAVSPNVPATPVVTRVVDTRTDTPVA